MSGINETSVNAYMSIAPQDNVDRRKKLQRRKKKRAASQAAGGGGLGDDESKPNLLTLAEDLELPQQD